MNEQPFFTAVSQTGADTSVRARRDCCRVLLAYYFTLSKVEFPTAVTDEITKIRLSPHINPHAHSLSLSLTPRGSAASRNIRTASSARALTAVRTLHSRAGTVREREGIEFKPFTTTMRTTSVILRIQ